MLKLLVLSLALALPASPLAAQTAAPAKPGATPPAGADAPSPEVKGKPASGGSKTKKAKTANPPRKGKKG